MSAYPPVKCKRAVKDMTCFLKSRNALGNEKTVKLVFIFKCMRSSL